MSNPDQPSNPPLTRRQMREIRNTGSTPIVTPAEPTPAQQAPEPEAVEPEVEGLDAALPEAAEAPETEQAAEPEGAEVEPEAAASPTPPAVADPAELGVRRLTRRQAREQERITTASVPVVVPNDAMPAPASKDSDAAAQSPFAPPVDPVDADQVPLLHAQAALGDEAPAATVSPKLGSALLDETHARVDLPPSFDQLLTRDTSAAGTTTAANALILSQTPTGPSMTSPLTATGEVMVTGTFMLPEGLGSQGHVPGSADNKETDNVLIDGELPAASSPTPIAASAAISTVRTTDEIIRPPAPEKGSRLMIVLAITAGALALALVGVLVLAVATGGFA